MASLARRLPANIDGEFFVDDSCIDCGACRWIAPTTFDRSGSRSRVHAQPTRNRGVRRALQALVACPTGSIGTEGSHLLAPITASFPEEIADGVHHCGFHSEMSFGAASYLIVRDSGNVLIDSPRFNRGLVRRIEALGGVDLMVLTHKDDVAEHARLAAHFGCDRMMHNGDITNATCSIERKPRGNAAVVVDEDLVFIPTPGHTRGSACLLYKERFLFGGDHIAYSRSLGHVYAFSGACWYDWTTQIASMKRLANYRFETILPGHGAPCTYAAGDMQRQLDKCIAWMGERAA